MDQDNKNNEDIDLSGALKDSDNVPESQNGEQQPAQTFLPGTPKIIQWTIKCSGGLIKDEKQASYVLISFIVVAIIISLVLVFGGRGSETKIEAPSGQRIIYPSDEPPRLQR